MHHITNPLVNISHDVIRSSQSGWLCDPGSVAGTAGHSNQQTEEQDVSTIGFNKCSVEKGTKVESFMWALSMQDWYMYANENVVRIPHAVRQVSLLF